MKKNFFLAIVIVLLIIIVSFLWLWNSKRENRQIMTDRNENLQNQQSGNENIERNEKVYKNERYNISFRYPVDWNVLEKDNMVYVYRPDREYSIENSPIYPISLSFDFENYNGKKTVNDWKKSIENIGLGEKKFEDIVVDSKKAVRARYYMGTVTLVLYDEKDNKQIIFSTPNFGDESINMENLKVYDSILESFDFESGNNWKVYIDKKYGFEFRYNPAWEIKDNGAVASIGGETLSLIVDKNRNDIGISITRFNSSEDPKSWYKTKGFIGDTLDKQYYISNYPVYYVKEDNERAHLLHKYLISNQKRLILFLFQEKYRKVNPKTGGIEETSFSQYLPDFEAMVNSIKFFD